MKMHLEKGGDCVTIAALREVTPTLTTLLAPDPERWPGKWLSSRPGSCTHPPLALRRSRTEAAKGQAGPGVGLKESAASSRKVIAFSP